MSGIKGSDILKSCLYTGSGGEHKKLNLLLPLRNTN
jgi:hypothetical protein